jgi:hypothetical protein
MNIKQAKLLTICLIIANTLDYILTRLFVYYGGSQLEATLWRPYITTWWLAVIKLVFGNLIIWLMIRYVMKTPKMQAQKRYYYIFACLLCVLSFVVGLDLQAVIISI